MRGADLARGSESKAALGGELGGGGQEQIQRRSLEASLRGKEKNQRESLEASLGGKAYNQRKSLEASSGMNKKTMKG